MNLLTGYLLPSVTCSLVLFSIYWLLMRRDTFFRINRFYLLSTIFISAAFPLVPSVWLAGATPGQSEIMLEAIQITGSKFRQTIDNHLPALIFVSLVYWSGVIFFLVRFLHQIGRIMVVIRKSDKKNIDGMNLVQVENQASPFSFFNILFLPVNRPTGERLNVIISHERVHMEQWHSMDIIFSSLYTVFNWFNPVAWILTRELRATHEFLADEGVLQGGIVKNFYRKLMLDVLIGQRGEPLANYFNVSLIKKRIAMMTKEKSGRWAIGKALLALPAVLLVMVLFSPARVTSTPVATVIKEIPNEPPQEKQEAFKTVEEMPAFPGGDAARVKFMMENLKYPQEAMKKGISGKVFVSFIVKSDGSIADVKILRGIGGGCDEEAMRVVKLMPKWKPGKNKGVPVDVIFNLPVVFALEKDKKVTPSDKASSPEKK
jgi:TonB family protein